MASQRMPLNQALAVMKQGQVCYADFYGKGWSTGYIEKLDAFFDINPHTGSTMLHTFDPPSERDQAAKWRIGQQPREPKP